MFMEPRKGEAHFMLTRWVRAYCVLIGGCRSMLHSDWRMPKYAAFWLEDAEVCRIQIGGCQSMPHSDWRMPKYAAFWLEDAEVCRILIGGCRSMPHFDWRMPKYAAFWLEESAEVALGLHSCSCWTEPALNQQTDTSSAGTWGHSPRSFCQHHTIAIIQMIWEDLSGQIKGWSHNTMPCLQRLRGKP